MESLNYTAPGFDVELQFDGGFLKMVFPRFNLYFREGALEAEFVFMYLGLGLNHTSSRKRYLE